MKSNMSTVDRWARVAIGFAIGAAGYFFNSWYGLIGLVPLATALVGWCPAYVPFGFSTCSRRSQESAT